MPRQLTKNEPVIKNHFKRVFFPLSLLYPLLGLEIDSPCDADGQMVWWRRLRQLILAPLAWIYFPFSLLCLEFGENKTITFLATCVYLIIALAFQLSHLVKCRRIRLYVKRSSAHISRRLSHVLLALSCSFIFLHFIQSSQQTMWTLTFWNYTTGELPATRVVIAAAFSWADYCFYEIGLLSMSIYSASILLHYNTVRVKTSLVLDFIRSNDKNSMLNTLDSIHSDHLEFESLFNLNPLFWLVGNLCMAVLTIIQSPELTAAKTYSIVGQGCLMMALLFIHHISSKISGLGNQVFESYSRTTIPRREINCYLYRLIDRAYNNQFTVWQMFQIDRSLIASYIGTVVTFSVLFVQIQNGALNKEN